MNALAAPTPSAANERKARAVGTPGSKTPDQAVQWRKDLVEALLCAAGTDESICYSGESERLLRAAHYLADAMSRRPEEFYDSGEATTVNEAYTIASLIKAALQVPGDTPSPERLAFIEQTRVPLVALTDDPGVLDGWETYPQSKAPALQTTQHARVLEVVAVQAVTLSNFLVAARQRAEGAGNIHAAGDFLMAQLVAEFMGSIADEACGAVCCGGPIAWAGGEGA